MTNIGIAMAGVAMLAGAITSITAHAQPGSDCQCKDARDLYSRYCAAQGAIREWDRLTQKVKYEEQKENRVISAHEAKDDVRKCVDEVINIYRQQLPGPAAGGATDANCEITVNAPTPCLRGVILEHESWHKWVCEAQQKPDAPWRSTSNPFRYVRDLIDWRYEQSAIDYMKEERTGYQREVEYLRNRLEELGSRCEVPVVFVPDPQQKRSYTIKPCPWPNYADYERKCTR